MIRTWARTRARTWVGLLACLLMQVGLLVGVSPAQAQREVQAHKSMMREMPVSCSEAKILHSHCGMTHTKSPAMPHDDKCCHVHVAATDIPTPADMLSSVLRSVVRARSPILSAQTEFVGADGLPPLRPPRVLNS
ncbi:hypothetical protein [Acetobacter orleanensis]|uniref:DUF2946 domain-containing protein n=1 Tax=Acetobacter orleanensis TaxID=104099 RepID=A0A4Y3TPC4_9PROT|nr:hypothetical protein [Acetobacter orleanensis]KXV63025.1 hypothetical protein AD949_08335 [Acetobacter orleanensis]PCD78825.1 hypothetical protein CO710_10165 [Acetobacter orleanensis]GAN68818.1 hypothetical protein Abol_022_032 [Acetobacter orleanensis JCM 7639]GEB83309.1 hypothetical protein AOR01nite_17860 [Acetobacter orleanensis]